MTAARRAALLLAAVSAGLLLGAYGFEHLGGLAPCELCWWQRYAHMAVIGVAGLALLTGSRGLATAGVAAMLTAAGLGVQHAGVEFGWWQVETACTTAMVPGMSQEALLDALLKAPLVRCDAVPWRFLGQSMAVWNALVSGLAALAAGWLLAAGAPGRKSGEEGRKVGA